MNRLDVINIINPSWHTQIVEFLSEHPEFNMLIPIVALDEYPVGFNKNPHENDGEAPINIFETIIYGVSHAGLSTEDGQQHYVEVLKFFRANYDNIELLDCIEESMFSFLGPPKKLTAYRQLVNDLLKCKIMIHKMTIEDLHIAEFNRGIGDSTIDLVHLLHSNVDDDRVIPYTDEYFIKGMEKLFGLSDTTEPMLKEITQTWKNKKVGVMFIIQYAYYADCINNNLDNL
jgi:hypothetical protein